MKREMCGRETEGRQHGRPSTPFPMGDKNFFYHNFKKYIKILFYLCICSLIGIVMLPLLLRPCRSRIAATGIGTSRPVFASLFCYSSLNLKPLDRQPLFGRRPRSLRIASAPLALPRSERFGWLSVKTSGWVNPLAWPNPSRIRGCLPPGFSETLEAMRASCKATVV